MQINSMIKHIKFLLIHIFITCDHHNSAHLVEKSFPFGISAANIYNSFISG
jgi:hypothetical protein